MNTEPDSLLPGTYLAGKYRLERIIGKGGFGAVFRATSLSNGAPVAIKVLSRSVLEQSGGIARFRREADLASRLKHPNTVRVLDAGEDGHGWLFIAFELLEGESVERALEERGAMTTERAALIASDALAALGEAHAIGIVHRDLKPANIFLVHDGQGERVKVLDFGIAKSTNPGTQAGLTRAGSTMGTPIYMSPEQILGQEVTPRSDLYALGIVLADMVLGVSPYGRDPHALEVITQRISGKPVPLPENLARSRIGAIIERATQAEPAKRFGSAGEMRAALLALAPTVNSLVSGPMQAAVALAATLEHQAVSRSQLAAPARSSLTVPLSPTLNSPAGSHDALPPPTVRDPWSGSHAPSSMPIAVGVSPRRSRSAAGVLIGVFVVLVVLGGVAGLLLYLQPGPLKGMFDTPKPRRHTRTEAAAPESTSDSPRIPTSSSAAPAKVDEPRTEPSSSAAPSLGRPTGTPGTRMACPAIDSLSKRAFEETLATQGLPIQSENHACDGNEIETNGISRCDGHEKDVYTLGQGTASFFVLLNKDEVDKEMQRLDEETGTRAYAFGSTHLLVSTLPLPVTKALFRRICGPSAE